jgi:acetyl esterase/lipase
MALRGTALIATALILMSTTARAESPMPADIAAKLVEIGHTIDGRRTGALYAPLQEKEPYQGVKVERDVKYGPADRNLLDVFAPEAATSPRPVLIFVHGGALVRGDRRIPGSPFNDNIMLWAVKNGFVGVNMTYRLVPEATWPAGPEDMGAAVAWVGREIAARGGDPSRVYPMGHSAGALHVASYVSHPEFYKVSGGGLAGAIMISGTYDLATTNLSDAAKVYFGSDPALYAERSAIRGLIATKIPLMIASAELDPPHFIRQFEELKSATCEGPQGCIRAVMLPQHSHTSEVFSINTADTRLTDQILEFARTGK